MKHDAIDFQFVCDIVGCTRITISFKIDTTYDMDYNKKKTMILKSKYKNFLTKFTLKTHKIQVGSPHYYVKNHKIYCFREGFRAYKL